MTTTLDRPHVWLPGEPEQSSEQNSEQNEAPLLLLHGTGGDEHDLLVLREHLAPTAPALSVRGAVLEQGMPRFFRRLREGVFDEDDLRDRVAELAAFLAAAEHEYGVAPGSWRAVGFSNGANIASALLLQRPETLAEAVLLAAMVPFHSPPGADLTGKRVAVVNGQADPMATPEHTTTLTEQLRMAGAQVSVLSHPGGHTIDPQQLPRVRQFLEEG